MQRVKIELRGKGPSVNVVMHSGLATRGIEEKVETGMLIHKVVSKQEGLDLDKAKETFMEALRDFLKTEAPTSLHPGDVQIAKEVKPFLHACMRLLCNPQVVQNL